MTNEALRRLFGVGFVVVAVSLAGWPAAAQEADDEEPASAAEEQDDDAAPPVPTQGILEEIVVTAQKRTENIQEVPVAISTLDEEELDVLTAGGQDVKFLSGRVPSVVAESSFGRAFPRFYIRGLGNTDFDLNASQPVSMVYDEVVLENPVLKGLPLWDIERVEVLRGPQGSLFGRNTPAGVIKFESRKPTRELDGFASLSYGTYDTIDFKAAVGGPISDTLSGRVSALYQSQSDWVDNGFTGERDALGGYDTFAGRVQLLWEPNDRFSGLLNLHGWDLDGTARIFRANIIEPGDDDLVSDFDQERVFHDGRNEQTIEGQGAVLKLDYDLGFGVLTSVTAFETLEMFSRGDIDGGFGAVFAPPSGPGFIPFPSESADGLPDLDQLTQEVRIASSGEGPLSWLAGLFWFDEEIKVDSFSFNSLGGNVQDGFAFQLQDSESWALFGTLGYEVTDRFKVQGGLRYTQDEKDFSAERPDPTFQVPTVRPITTSTDADQLSWDLSGTFEVSPETNLYARVATGFRAPSIQGRILFCPDFEGGTNPATNCLSVADEEEILSFEVGTKSQLFDRRVRLYTALYAYELDGQQIVAVGGQFNTATLLNSDTTEGYGFESDIEYAPNSNWLFKTGISYNSTEIKDDNLFVAPCGGGCTVTDPRTPGGLVIVDGNSLPHAPEWIVNGLVDYRLPIADGVFVGSLDWAWHSEKRFFLYESEEFESDFLEIGLRFSYAFDRYEVGLYGRNIADEEINLNGIDFNNLTGMTNEPRQVGLQASVRF